jgi:hypothetical protein
MSVASGPNVYTTGLVYLLDPTLFDGTTTDSVNSKPTGSTWTLYNYTTGTRSSLTTLQSNCGSNGAGTSYITVSRNSALETGSITFQIWYNLENITLNSGVNNNWRGLLCTADSGTAGSPLTLVQEEGYDINFSTTHTDGYRRFLNSAFSPVVADATGWQCVTYCYDQATGIASCYKNDTLIRSGPMTTDTIGSSPTAAGTALSYTNYQASGFRIYGGNNTAADPNGNGILPGEVGNILFYNVALTQAQVTQNFNAYRGRFNI